MRASGVGVASALAAILALIGSSVADPLEVEPSADHFLLFSGADLWRQGAFLYGGNLWAPNGFDADGLVVKLMAVKGAYAYRSGAFANTTVLGLMLKTTILPGFRLTRGPLSLTFFAGPDFELHRLFPDDSGNAARGAHLGLRAAVEFWLQATSNFMLAGSATATTVAASYAARLAGGWRVFEQVYVGPEAQLYGSDHYQQYRFGLHVIGVKYKSFEWQGALGYAVDDDDSGIYVRVGLISRM